MALQDYYTENIDSQRTVFGVTWAAQSFTTSESYSISSVMLKLYRYGNPATLTVSIRAVDGNGQPTGSDLCVGTLAGNGLTTDSDGAEYLVQFTSVYSLAASTKYAIVAKATSGNGLNFVAWKCDAASATYSGGWKMDSGDSGSNWNDYTGSDHYFKTYDTEGLQLFEHYNLGDVSTFNIGAAATFGGQTFTPTVAYTITSVRLKLYRTGTPGDATIGIQATSSDLPDNTYLTSETISLNGITKDTSGEWVEIAFGTSVTLSVNTKYAIVVQALDTDSSNRIYFRINTSGTYAGGNAVYSNNSGVSWAHYANSDWMFETYGYGANVTDDDGTSYLWVRMITELMPTVTPYLASVKLADPNPNKIAKIGSDNILDSVNDLTGFIAGTTNQITVMDDEDGTITLSLPQDYDTGATPTLADLTLSAPSNIYALSHDSFADFVENEHINHTSITLTAGTGLTGGGDISANRTFAVDGVLEDLDTLGASTADGEFLVATGAGTLAWESGVTARTSIGLGSVEDTALSTWAGSTNIITLGTIATGTWNGTTIAIANGGTGQTTQQAAIDALTAVSGATNEHVLTKDTATGNAIFKVSVGGADEKVKVDAAATADYIGAAYNDGVLRVAAGMSYTDGGDYITIGGFDSRCRVVLSGNQTIETTSWTKVEFDDEDYDGLNEWDSTNHKFTATYAGYYKVNAKVYIDDLDDGDQISISVRKNGNMAANNHFINAKNEMNVGIFICDIIYLAASDYIEVFTWHNEGANQLAIAVDYVTFVSIHRLS